jgi:hypothetical protein
VYTLTQRPTMIVISLAMLLGSLLGMPGGASGARDGAPRAGVQPAPVGGVQPAPVRGVQPAPVAGVQTVAAIGLTYQWHTFYGLSAEAHELRGVAVDAAGNVYIAGTAGATWGTPLHAYSGDADIVVIKLNSQGVYQWHTFYGAAPSSGDDGDDEAMGVAIDVTGNVYVVGYSDRTWQGPRTTDHPLTPHMGDAEYMFVLKLNSDGGYQWHTFYQPGRAYAIALDGAGNALVTGYATSEVAGALRSAAPDGRLVVLKLNSSGIRQWHTYYGGGSGAGDEAGYGVTTDGAGNVYVTGAATYEWLGEGDTLPLYPFSGNQGAYTEIMVLKLGSGGAYQWHTFAGAPTTDDVGNGIAYGANRLTVAGSSYTSWGSPRHAHSGGTDLAILQLNDSGQRQWNTFYGSSGNDVGTSVTVDAAGNAYVGGWSSASWLGDGGAAPGHPFSETGLHEITVLKVTGAGSYARHTFYGASSAHDRGVSIALDQNYGVFVTGTSWRSWLGAGGASPIRAHSGNDIEGDGFVLKLLDRVYRLYVPAALRSQ